MKLREPGLLRVEFDRCARGHLLGLRELLGPLAEERHLLS